MAVAISSLISSFLLSHLRACFGLCNSLGGHICGDRHMGGDEVIKGCWTAREIGS